MVWLVCMGEGGGEKMFTSPVPVREAVSLHKMGLCFCSVSFEDQKKEIYQSRSDHVLGNMIMLRMI